MLQNGNSRRPSRRNAVSGLPETSGSPDTKGCQGPRVHASGLYLPCAPLGPWQLSPNESRNPQNEKGQQGRTTSKQDECTH
jgi:hypothetical protein